MSGNAQFDLHPDADSLNAFAEQALAGQERERLVAHLAVCSCCREVVFLAQEANVEARALVAAAAAPAAAYVSKPAPWFRNLRLVWVPVAALAAGITVVYVNYARHQEATTQMAQIEKGAAAVNATPPGAATTSKGDASSASKAEKQAVPTSRGLQQVEAMPEAQVQPPDAVAPVGEKQNTLQAISTAELKNAPEGAVAGRERQTTQVAGEMRALTAKKAEPASTDRVERAQDQAGVSYAPVMQAEVAPAPVAKSVGAAQKAGGSLAMYMAKPVGLPSGLAAVSTATAQHNVLAVDKAGSLYLSSDAGAHWAGIERQWSGRAVAVRVQVDANASGGTPQNTFELVNDQGQVWVSSDGKSWNAK